MTKAIWNGTVIADSDATVEVEGNAYFPPDALVREHFRESRTTSVCGWKGTASYYDVVVDGETNSDAAWTYRDPKPEVENIRGLVAFWKGVRIEP